ncbi:hypothetical protein KVR01_011473 [Diaporthe batatas]|uniref:uncharacterized protein n=1 Tax=Diaporthe batatas TaxID=748121 RepID=UPI001D044D2E|nr:uncharacterized protein KVR01_011473 [Diaporthe batatas]KAG8159030.1 hypothetical protein KVR01_011473 [Diaporthe batatas]
MPRVLLSTRQSHQGISRLIWNPRLHLRGVFQHDGSRVALALVRRATSVAFTSPAYSQSPASAKKANKAAQVIAVEDHAGVPADEVTSFSKELKEGIAETISRKRAQSATKPPTVLHYPTLGSPLYGKWQSLSVDHERLLIESDVNVSDSRLVRLVDQPGNENDIELWSCLLEFCQRLMGRDGVVMIWQSLSKRRNLYQVDGPLAQAFWGTIINAAVTNDTLLREVVAYGEWLLENHEAHWPQLYTTVMSHMLLNRPKAETLRWHMTLSSSFAPTEVEFVGLLKRFIMDPAPEMQETLQLLYSWSPHRKLYDIIIPHLYAEGHAYLASQWRRLLVDHGDNPASLAARPFLRYVGAYYPQTWLSEEELSIAGLVLHDRAGSEGGTVSDGLPVEAAINGQNLSYLVNRVHGETFGIREKTYNDKLGSKWFASTWVSLDFAISVVYTMGITRIGPLSLQSIALREGNAEGVLHRLDQLRQYRIRLPNTDYVSAIRYYARIGDDEALQELLHCDIHPDIFEDELAQQELLNHCLNAGEWGTYQLILKTKFAVASYSVAISSDKVLHSCASQGNGPMALALLQGLCSRNLHPAPMTSHLLSSFVIQNLSPHADVQYPRPHVDLQVSLCRELSRTRFPPAVEAWRVLLSRLGRDHRLAELERLSADIVRLFVEYTRSDTPMWISHMADVPELLRSESPYPHFQKLPRDLPLHLEGHPLRQIFDPKLQGAIVRWGFTNTSYTPAAEEAAHALLLQDEEGGGGGGGGSTEPADFHFARGIRLLAMLRDQGLHVYDKRVLNQALLRLTDLYRGGGDARYEWIGGSVDEKRRRLSNQLSLAQAKRLCDLAWGRELLPDLPELMSVMEDAMRRDKLKEIQARVDEIKRSSW